MVTAMIFPVASVAALVAAFVIFSDPVVITTVVTALVMSASSPISVAAVGIITLTIVACIILIFYIF